MHIDFYRGRTHRKGKNGSFFSLSGMLPSLFLLSSKWGPIPTLFRMITDRYNKNGNIRPLCARQLATGMNARSGLQLPSSPLHLQLAHRHKGHVTCEIRSCRYFSHPSTRSVLKYTSNVTWVARNRKVSNRIWNQLVLTDYSPISLSKYEVRLQEKLSTPIMRGISFPGSGSICWRGVTLEVSTQ